jgi:hypothetical protein
MSAADESNVHAFPIDRSGGYVYAYRRAWTDEHFNDLFDAAVWNYIYQNAVWEPEGRKIRFNGRVVHAERGQLITSLSFLAKGFRTTVKVIRGVLARASAGHMLVMTGGTHFSVITVCKYNDYQPRESLEGKPRANAGRREGNNNKERNYTEGADETRNVGERGGPGGGRLKASPPAPSDDRRGYGNEAALPGQPVLPAIEDVEPERLAPVPVEASAPELGSPSIVVEVLVDPAPVTAPPPEVGSPPAVSNVVPISAPAKPKRERAVKTRWLSGTEVPADWIAEGYAIAFRLGMTELNVEEVAGSFADHWASVGESRADWRAAFRNWIRREQKFYRGSSNGNGYHNGHAGTARPITGQNATVELRRLILEKRRRGSA